MGQASTGELLGHLCERHPWLATELRASSHHVYATRHTLPAPIDRVWATLSDTSRINRAVGIPAARFEERDGRRQGESTYFRRPFRWSEPPWEWSAPHHFCCRKEFERGPLARMTSLIDLQPVGADRTEVVFWYGWEGRGLLGGLACRRVVRFLATGFDRLLPELAASLLDASDAPSLVRPPRSHLPGAVGRARQLRDELASRCDPDLASRLVDHLMQGDAIELDRLRPFVLADGWEQPRSAVLLAFLDATATGLTLARWDVVCPHCRGVRATIEQLDALDALMSCDACEVRFETGASALELTFRVHPSLRHVEPRVYCAAEPATKPHIQLQQCNREPRAVRAPLAPGAYLLRDGDHRSTLEVADDAPLLARIPDDPLVAPGGTLQLPPASSRWVLERIETVDDAVQPEHVLSLDRYREVMGAESLGADLALEIGVQTLLFTDVVGSTALYERLGDRAAFEAVRRHFEVVGSHVRAEGGAVVKTIGDAVMAAFTTPQAAARAARHIARADLGELSVRLSLHTGPCIAVNLDTGLDYFGRVVNEAAKLQAAADAGQVALRAELAERLGLEGRPATYRYGPHTHDAIVWTPTSDGTPAGVRRQLEA